MLFDKLRSILESYQCKDDFVICTMADMVDDEDCQKVIDFIENNEDVTPDDISLFVIKMCYDSLEKRDGEYAEIIFE